MSWSAHVAAWKLVGVDILFLDKAIGHPIGSRRIVSANQIALRAIGAIGAAVKDELYALRDHNAVLLDTGLNFHNRAMARVAGDQFFGVVDQKLDRSRGF